VTCSIAVEKAHDYQVVMKLVIQSQYSDWLGSEVSFWPASMKEGDFRSHRLHRGSSWAASDVGIG
jgi:hypothetical protein